MRMPFDRIFAEIDGCFVPQVHIGIGPVVMAAGVPLPPDSIVEGLDLGKLKDCDSAVELEDGIIMIQGFYSEDRAEGAAK